MNHRIAASLIACLSAGLCLPETAEAQDMFGRTEPIYDLSGSPLIRDRLDYAYINGDKPTYAEMKGLAGAPTVEVRRNYLYVQDSDGSLNIPWQSQNDLFESFNFAVRELYQVLPDEFVFIYLFTTFQTGVGAFFYSPEANDVRGMGQQRFDNNGPTPRQGFVFMNYWQSFNESFQGAPQNVIDAQALSVFNQEAGHRWGAFVDVGSMLGRDDSHWSYFMNTGGSPMEGNAWRANGDGTTFTTTTNFVNYNFSDLDLYLMGLLPSNQVQPWFVITNPQINGQRDIYGRTITAASPPQIFQPVTIAGTRTDITIEQIQGTYGVRDPAAGDSPTSWRVVFLILGGQTSGLNESEKVEFEGMVDDYAGGFSQGSRGLGSLDYLLMGEPRSPIGGPCESLDDCDQLEANLCFPGIGQPPVGLCTRPCTQASSCPTNWCCDNLSGSASQVCLPEGMCEPTPPPCPCDVTGECDEGCACDMTCEDVKPCECDTGEGCQENCACDAACETTIPPTACLCDVTYACDDDPNGGECACDVECKALATDRRGGGCGCSATETGSFGFGGLLLLGLLLVRRRK